MNVRRLSWGPGVGWCRYGTRLFAPSKNEDEEVLQSIL